MCYLCFLFYLLLSYLAYYIIKIVWTFYKLSKQTPYAQPDLQKRLTKENIPQNIDYIIIGSGLGGLINAAILSKLGKRVLVLEQHTIPGGCCHSFTEKGYEFDTGFHYIGNKSDYRHILNFVLSKKIEWNVIKQFDNIKLNDDKPFQFSGPHQTFVQNLKDEFPDYSKQIDQYFAKLIKGNQYMGLLFLKQLILPKFLTWIIDWRIKSKFQDVANQTIYQVQEQLGITKNQRLTAILNSQFMDIGQSPKKCPFPMYSGLFLHYTEGAIYPQGGPMQIVESIIGTIDHHGGQVFTKARVDKIIIENGQVQGVILQSGIKLKCNNVVSAIGLQQTISLLDQQYQWKINQKQGISHLYCFIGLKGKDAGIGSSNQWHLKCGQDYDLDFMRDQFNDNFDEKYFSTFTCSSTAKQQNQGDKQSVIMLAEAKPELVEKYRINEVQRKDGYKEFKQKVQDMFLREFCKQFPDQKDKIDYIDVATPLTNENYYGRYASYALDTTIERFQDFEVYLNFTTKHKGLYLTGQDTFFAGIACSIMSGFLSALKIKNIL